MEGAARRIERQADSRNLQAYNMAKLMGAKLPEFNQVFRKRPKPGMAQPGDVLEANLWALARAWGAK